MRNRRSTKPSTSSTGRPRSLRGSAITLSAGYRTIRAPSAPTRRTSPSSPMCSTSRSRAACSGAWELDELRRRQVLALLDHMLRVEGSRRRRSSRKARPPPSDSSALSAGLPAALRRSARSCSVTQPPQEEVDRGGAQGLSVLRAAPPAAFVVARFEDSRQPARIGAGDPDSAHRLSFSCSPGRGDERVVLRGRRRHAASRLHTRPRAEGLPGSTSSGRPPPPISAPPLRALSTVVSPAHLS